MINISGQLAIKTRHGRYGPFNVGYLATALGDFVVKNAELDQYDEGKYAGDFAISNIRTVVRHSPGLTILEHRAQVDGMEISSIHVLSGEDANKLSPQEIDPVEEEAAVTSSTPAAPEPIQAAPEPVQADPPVALDPLVDTTPFSVETPPAPLASESSQDKDATLFGNLWPLNPVVKLDPTVDRLVFRKQIARLRMLGYDPNPRSQDFRLKAA